MRLNNYRYKYVKKLFILNIGSNHVSFVDLKDSSRKQNSGARLKLVKVTPGGEVVE